MRRAVDRGRLLRAIRLEVERVGPNRYRVTGGEAPHGVHAPSDGPWSCDCADAARRPAGACKHRLAVYLARQLAAPVRAALREVAALR